jgi:hypothetical protein
MSSAISSSRPPDMLLCFWLWSGRVGKSLLDVGVASGKGDVISRPSTASTYQKLKEMWCDIDGNRNMVIGNLV